MCHHNENQLFVIMKHRLFRLWSLAFLCLTIIPCVFATDVTIDGIKYSIDTQNSNGYATVTGVEDGMTECIIPESVSLKGKSYPVTTIGSNAFTDSSIESVVAPQSVVVIGSYAFARASNLKEVYLSNVKVAYSRIFQTCENLEKVDYGYSEKFGEEPFWSCSRLKEIIIRNPDAIIPREIYYGGYDYHTEQNILLPIEKLTIPYPTEYRENWHGFYNYNATWKNAKSYSSGSNSYYYPATLKEITYLGDSEKKYKMYTSGIGKGEINYVYNLHNTRLIINFIDIDFYDLGDIDKIPEFYKHVYNVTSFSYSGNQILPSAYFRYSPNLKSLSLPFPGVGSVDSFSNFGELFSTKSDDGLRAVVQYFENGSQKTYYLPTSLEELTITEGCGIIPYGGLSGCNMLKKLTLPSSIYMVGEKALYGCAQLSDIYCKGADPAVAFSNSFDGMRLTSCKLHVPYKCCDLYKNAEGWQRFYYIQEEAPLLINVIKNIANAGVIYGLEEYRPGQEAKLRAVANSGYTFIGWYEDDLLLSSEDTYKCVVTGNKTIIARFAPVSNSNNVTVSTTHTNATLIWNKINQASAYVAEIYDDAYMTTPIASIAIDATGQTITRNGDSDGLIKVAFNDLNEATEYYYLIKAENENNMILSEFSGSFTTSSADISDMINDPQTIDIVGYINMQGIRSPQPWQGYNIIVYSDGSIRKIFIE